MAFTWRPGRKLCFFGDSITQFGWYVPLTTYLTTTYTHAGTPSVVSPGAAVVSRTATSVVSASGAAWSGAPVVINAGVSGNKVADLVARVNTDVIALSPTDVIIECGVNDVIAGTVRATFQASCATLLNAIVAGLPTAQIAWVNILCYGESYPDATWGATINQYNADIASAVGAVGGTTFDIRTAQQTYESINNTPPPGAVSGILTDDGVHPNATGKQFMCDTVLAASIVQP